jgi:hypothetical protein
MSDQLQARHEQGPKIRNMRKEWVEIYEITFIVEVISSLREDYKQSLSRQDYGVFLQAFSVNYINHPFNMIKG